jgi:hypothetical protein
VTSPTNNVTSRPSTSLPALVTTNRWWEFIPAPAAANGSAGPTTNTTATMAQATQWNPVQTEQSAAHAVAGQQTMNIVANVMMHQDFIGTFEIFDAPTYANLNNLMLSQQTVFVSSPFGSLDSGYFRIGPQSGGGGGGGGTKTKDTKLMPSTVAGPHREVQVNAVAQPRPPT